MIRVCDLGLESSVSSKSFYASAVLSWGSWALCGGFRQQRFVGVMSSPSVSPLQSPHMDLLLARPIGHLDHRSTVHSSHGPPGAHVESAWLHMRDSNTKLTEDAWIHKPSSWSTNRNPTINKVQIPVLPSFKKKSSASPVMASSASRSRWSVAGKVLILTKRHFTDLVGGQADSTGNNSLSGSSSSSFPGRSSCN